MAEQEIQDAITSLLKESNRPYNGNNLVDEMSARFKKSLIKKALDVLETTKRVQVKEFGKVKIFLADQSEFDVPNEEELAALDAEIKATQQEGEAEKAAWAKIQETAESLEATATNKALAVSHKELTETVKKLKRQVAQCLSSSDSDGSPSVLMDKKTLEKVVSQAENSLRKRKRICIGWLQDVGAETGYRLAELYDEIGIEADEAD